jgi:glycosyltransferase involved in cell wall biosynthesis
LDVHQATVVATVRIPADGGRRHVVTQTFGTMTTDLLTLRDWLQAHGVTHVALESTGVYWKPVYYVLEDAFTLLLINMQELKHVPGRKTDVNDSEWLAPSPRIGAKGRRRPIETFSRPSDKLGSRLLMARACTIVARNYVAHARVLANSFLAHHPGGEFTVLLIDDEAREFGESSRAFQCVRLSDIGLDQKEIGRLAAIYDVTELATAVKPPLLRYLLSSGRGDVIYLDPDIRIYGSLAEVSELAQRHSIVLTPHTMVPMPRDERRIDEFQILAAGVYNLGFIAVGPGSAPFIEWWWQKTRREAFSDPLRMMFTDQRWVDFVPGFFDHAILKDPTYNVAYWNLHGRNLEWRDGTYFVDGAPLKFFHFSGFDAKRPYLLSKHQGDKPRILLSENPALARICEEYGAELEQAGHQAGSALPYGWATLPSGIPLGGRMRRVYGQGLAASEEGREAEPPLPFGETEQAFIDWLNEPVPVGIRTRVSRYLYSLYLDREDLRRAFPNLAGADGPRYMAWVRAYGVQQEPIPTQLLPPEAEKLREADTTYVPPSALTRGINVAGYFRAELGVGEAARLLTDAIEATGIPHSTIDYGATLSRRGHVFAERGGGRAPYDVNVVCVNADQTPQFAADAGTAFFEGRHTAGFWFWELEQFPSTMHAAFDHVDEVWTATRFVASGIRAIGRRPVFTVPLPIPVPSCSPQVTRSSLGLSAGFMFLFMFDFFSVVERKNPIGLINAFARAFRPSEGPILVIKTINGASRLNDVECVRAVARDRPDIFIVDNYYSAEQKNSLLGLCDCYVSLHRSEGLGLTMGEAMGLGKPVIATAYSGNLDFMTPDNSYLVDYVQDAVPAGCTPYPKGAPWADPSIDQAAEYMRRVYEAPTEAVRKGQLARQDVLTKHNAASAGRFVAERLESIERTRATLIVPATAGVHEQIPELPTLNPVDHLLTPTPSVARRTPLRPLLLFAQRLLFRILRPYWWQQRELQKQLVSDLRDTMNAARTQRQELASLSASVRALEASGVAIREAMNAARTAHRQESESLWTGVHETGNAARVHRQELASLWTALHALEVSSSKVPEDVLRFQESARVHLKALTEQLQTLTKQLSSVSVDLTTLNHRLFAVPHMDDPERFSYVNDRGSRVLGFRSSHCTGADIYLGFENVFRGSETFIRDRFRAYLPLLQGSKRVVEIGSGRGEVLDLLQEAGIAASGVDIDDAMVKRCRLKGHTVERIDGNAFLRTQSDRSLPAIFCAHVVEHLAYDEFIQFLTLAHAKLAEGGKLIFETVNPHALEAFKTFWTDLSHQKPIFPEVAVVLCWLMGFESAYVFFPNGEGDLEKDRAVRGEYAIVATK